MRRPLLAAALSAVALTATTTASAQPVPQSVPVPAASSGAGSHTGASATHPARVTRVRAVATPTRIRLTWVNPRSPGFAATQIRESRARAVPVVMPGQRPPKQGRIVATVSRPKHSVMARNLVPGTSYRFLLTAMDRAGHPSKAVSVMAATPPEPVFDPGVFNDGAGYRAQWVNPTEGDFAAVIVRYARGGRAPARPSVGVGVPVYPAAGTSAALPLLAPGKRYSVAIWTVDSNLKLSSRRVVRFTTAQPTAGSGTVEGTITESAGNAAPLSGAQVIAYGENTGVSELTSTDSSGHYSLTLPPDQYVLEVDGSQATGGDSDATGYTGNYRLFSVRPARTTTAGLSLDRGAAISGRLVDGTGQPVAGVVPAAQPVQPYVNADGLMVTFGYAVGTQNPSASDGTFVLKGLAPGAWQVCAESATGAFSQVCGQRSVDVTAGTQSSIGDVRQPPQQGGTLTGTVRGVDGAPIPDAVVDMQTSGKRFALDAEALTDQNGRFRADGLPAGVYTVCASADPLTEQASLTGSAPGCHPSGVVLVQAATKRVDVTLPIGSAISGRVRMTDGAPLGGVIVIATSKGDFGPAQSAAITDGAGDYTVKGLPAGAPYVVCFRPDQAASRQVPRGAQGTCWRNRTTVSTQRGEVRAGVDQTLRPAGMITGTITDAAGNPLADAPVDVIRGRSQFAGSGAITGPDGRYRVLGLRSGSYLVCAAPSFLSNTGACYHASGDMHRRTRVSVTPGHTRSGVDIREPAEGTITVNVVDDTTPEANPIAGVDVALLHACPYRGCDRIPLFSTSSDVEVVQSWVTDADGAVSFADVTPGDYALCFFAFYGATAANDAPTGYGDTCTGAFGSVIVHGGEQVPVAETLHPAGAVTGTVTDTAGNPLAGAVVRVSYAAASDYGTSGFDPFFADEGPRVTLRTGPKGRYTVKGVTPGEQTICVSAASAHGGVSTDGYGNACLGGATRASATPLQVDAGVVTQAPDIELPAAAAITGTVTDTAGHPITAVGALLFRGNNFLQGIDVNADGSYAFTGLSARPVTVCFYSVQYRSECYDNVPWNRGLPLPKGITPVTPAPGGTEVDAQLARAPGRPKQP